MSSGLRVTQRTIANTMLSGLQSNMTRMQKIQEQLSSGRLLNRPSDSPVKTVEAMQFRSELRRAEQYVRNADDGLALLGTTDAALTNVLTMTHKVRELTLQGMNASTGQLGREAIAVEIDALREGLLGIANTRYLDRPVFGGNTQGPAAYTTPVANADPALADPGGAYQGDAGEVVRTVAAGTQVVVNVTGEEVFGVSQPSGSQLFDVLRGISAALRNQPPAAGVTDLSDGLAKLDTAKERVITTLGKVGARFNRVETMKLRAEDQLLTMSSSLSEVENIDLPKTIVELQMQEVAYNAALGATARAIQPSLLDFLR